MEKYKRLSGVVVKVNGECLLCKRNGKSSYPNMWSIPSGHVEKDESTKEAAYREFYEETDINIDNYDLDFVGILPKKKKTDGSIKGMMYVYLLNTHEYMYPNLETAQDGHEHTECGYFGLDKVNNMDTGVYLKTILQNIFEKD
jgi:ADP-ribose pyrophosphatase YjhB (NUDIX family)